MLGKQAIALRCAWNVEKRGNSFVRTWSRARGLDEILILVFIWQAARLAGFIANDIHRRLHAPLLLPAVLIRVRMASCAPKGSGHLDAAPFASFAPLLPWQPLAACYPAGT